MRLTKIYTKIGDKGTTMLASGASVAKDHVRIEAYGAVDELNAFVGELKDMCVPESKVSPKIIEALFKVQQELFDVGGELATPSEVLNTDRQQVVLMSDIQRLEREIDFFNETLEPLKNFVLPGGHPLNSKAHVCRTVCRRAERLIVKLSKEETIREEVGIYVNRLSDWFFVLSRVFSKELGREEVLWNQKRRP